MATVSRTSPIVPEERAGSTGLTIDAAIDSYRLSLWAGKKSPARPSGGAGLLQSVPRRTRQPRVLRAIRREHVEAFIVSLQDAGLRPATVSVAYRSLQPFFQ
ncbi:MAG: hypothetical protein M0Z49_05100 [Chloroflexi bacterium]|nr:hypothetical protein [Chloroflexota bacterium]